MTAKSAETIRQLRARHPQMRERDFARIHAISEAELVASNVGLGTTRLRPDVPALLEGLRDVGEAMALTRNESVVHEKIGPYEEVVNGHGTAMVLGKQVDLRIFPRHWRHGYAVEKTADGGAVRRSLQFFDAQGHAIHKIHARPATDLAAWQRLVETLRHPEQVDTIVVEPKLTKPERDGAPADRATLRERWAALTDMHQFFGMLAELNLDRLTALEMVGADYAWQLDAAAVPQLLDRAAASALPLMVFVGNRGCIQIHSGPIATVKPMGQWLNVMDETFHLHLRLDHISAVWAVRKPSSKGHVTSVEVYDAAGELVIQFFGQRQEGFDERPEWRDLVAALPPLPSVQLSMAAS